MCNYIISAQVSMTFDPFMSLSVPIPRNLRHLPVIFVPRDPNIMPIEVGGCVATAPLSFHSLQYGPDLHPLPLDINEILDIRIVGFGEDVS